MMKISCKAKILFAIFFTIQISACGSNSPSSDQIAGQLQLSYATGPVIHPNEAVEVYIENQSDFCIEYPYNFDIHIYEGKIGTDKEVPDFVTYTGRDPLQLPSKDNLFPEVYVSLAPDWASVKVDKPTDFFGVITGHLCDDESMTIKKEIPFQVVP